MAKIIYIEGDDPQVREFVTKLKRIPKTFMSSPERKEWAYREIQKKAKIIIVYTVIAYILFLISLYFFWIPGMIVCGLLFATGLALIGFNIGHDASHGTFARTKQANERWAFAMNVIGGAKYTWGWQHVKFHHTDTNIEDHDPDISFSGLLRILSTEKWHPIYRLQYLYAWLLYGVAGLHIVHVRDILAACTNKLSGIPFPFPIKEKLIMIGTKLVHLTICWFIPALFIGLWYSFLLYLLILCVSGFIMGVVFQLAHILCVTKFFTISSKISKAEVEEEVNAKNSENQEVVIYRFNPDDDIEVEHAFCIHQIITAADFAVKNKVANWGLGGLNLQTMHHVYVGYPHTILRKIQPRFARLCKEYKIPYNVFPTVWSALRDHGKKLYQMGLKPAELNIKTA